MADPPKQIPIIKIFKMADVFAWTLFFTIVMLVIELAEITVELPRPRDYENSRLFELSVALTRIVTGGTAA